MRTRRLERCERCQQPLPVCICDLVRPIAVRTKIVVLVHWLEAFKTTNTGRLAALTFGARYERWGEQGAPRPPLGEGPLLLLFPSSEARPLEARDAEAGATLVVPDGNWPQARKIARRVASEGSERVSLVRLDGDALGRYTLRHTERAGAVSTFEAIAHALRILEGERGEEVTTQALTLFDAFVARHAPFAAGLGARARGSLAP